METERDVADRVAKPSSLGDVARRITSRTTDLVAISIVLVASLTLGRQILHWWHAEPPATTTAAVDAEFPGPAWDDELQPLSLEFGDLPLSLTRQVVLGDQEAAVEALVRHCQAAAEVAESPVREPDNAEQRLLEKVVGLTPVAQQGEDPDAENAGDWHVYVVDERFTLVAAVRRFPDELKKTARSIVRLVCWGTAMPTGERAWTLYLFREAPVGSASPAGLPRVPLPPGAQRNLSVRDERGGALIGYSGSGSPQDWMKFYDDWFLRQGWSKTDKWSIGTESWSASFRRQHDPDAGRVEIRFAADGDGRLTGLIQIQ